MVFIYPNEMKVGVRESYIGPMFEEDANRIKLKGYVSTDIYAQKEFFKKRVFLSSTISNLFNTSYKTLDHPSVWYGGFPLPAKGRTFYIKGEYRF